MTAGRSRGKIQARVERKKGEGFVLGLDIGTGSSKALLFREDGSAWGQAVSFGYPLKTDAMGRAELDPRDVYRATCRAIRECQARAGLKPGQVRAIGLSSAWHSLVAVDEAGKPLTAILTWADTRPSRAVARLRSQLDGKAIHRATGCPLHSIYLPAKIAWLREEREEIFRRAARFLSVKEYILQTMLGRAVVDYSVASAGLLDLHSRRYHEGLLRTLDLSSDRLSPLVEFDEMLQGLPAKEAEELYLDPEVPWVVGTGDGAASNLGLGALQEEELALMIGTSGAVRLLVEGPRVDEEGRLFTYYAFAGRYVFGGAINNGGLARDWIVRLLRLSKTEEDRLGEFKPDLIFLPYLTGQRCPGWKEQARACFLGLALDTGREDLLRAVLEGVCFSLREIVEILEELGGRFRRIWASGGFTGSRSWCQLLADVLGRPVDVHPEPHASVRGAALLAMKALGWISSWEEAGGEREAAAYYRPDPQLSLRYEEKFARFRCAYRRLYQGEREGPAPGLAAKVL
jgi:gluconokinase